MGQSSTKQPETQSDKRTNRDNIYFYDGKREETFRDLRELDPICCDVNSQSYTFRYNEKINIELLKPFFDANVAVVVAECVKENNGKFSIFNEPEIYYNTKFEGLKYFIKQPTYSKIEIIIYGDRDIIGRAVKIVQNSYNTSKQKLINELNAIGK